MKLREVIENATPGPWEWGDHWSIQGASHCSCADKYGPLVYEGRMDINGSMMKAHVHRSTEPWYKVGIYTAWLDKKSHEPFSVVVESDEYGTMEPADAQFIATYNPEHVALMEQVIISGVADVHGYPTDAYFALRDYRKAHGYEG